MATAAQAEALRRSYDEVERLVRRDLRKVWPRLRGADPKTIRNVLLDLTPRLSDLYGTVALSIAAEWFETVTRQTAVTAPLTAAEAVQSSTRAQAGGLWAGRREEALASIVASTTRHALQAGRDTIAVSSQRRGMRYARSPEPGACAWCILLASRGAVYGSAQEAQFVFLERGAGGRTAGSKWHDFCRCTPEPAMPGASLSYDQDALYDRYRAVHRVGDTDAEVTRKMRETYGLS